eukprot:973341-Rhodomonas_salina.3
MIPGRFPRPCGVRNGDFGLWSEHGVCIRSRMTNARLRSRSHIGPRIARMAARAHAHAHARAAHARAAHARTAHARTAHARARMSARDAARMCGGENIAVAGILRRSAVRQQVHVLLTARSRRVYRVMMIAGNRCVFPEIPTAEMFMASKP